MVSLGVAVVVCIVLAITMTSIACACRKGRRPTISGIGKSHPTLTNNNIFNNLFSEHIELPLQSPVTSEFKLAPAPKGKAKAPTSLPPMAINPIYDGPTYESPGGESLKTLLGGSSVPNTPLGLTTPTGDTSRYFNMPPSLPPPRKNSISARAHPQGIPEEVEETCDGSDKYAEMKPIRSMSSMVQRPSNVPPAVFEAMGGGEYASIRQ